MIRPLEPGLSLRAWRLLRRLGRGGDGDVWLAVDSRGQEVALKAAPAAESPDDESRLRREFEHLRALRLPSVVRVLDVGADQGYVFFTMELARGVAFDAYVAGGKTLEERVQRLARAGAGVARALVGVHRLGLAHRDLKPANVLVAEDGAVTLLDFGAMRFGAGLDATGDFIGTVHYMAPEQRTGLPSDPRVDLYALGVTLHEALSGTPAGHWKPGRARRPLACLGPEVPLALSALVDSLVALDPATRPSADASERLLLGVLNGERQALSPWPSPVAYAGDASPLLAGTAIVVGAPGTGRRRMIEEARWLWYRKGYRSIAGQCTPDRPFGALRAVLVELFAIQDTAVRRRLAGEDGRLLASIWPELPVPVSAPAPWPPDPDAVGRALARVLSRAAPMAVAFWDLELADPGTLVAVSAMARALPADLPLWASSRRPLAGLPSFGPPAWSTARDRESISGLLPEGTQVQGPPGRSPLASVARVWRALARWRGEPGPASVLPGSLAALAVLVDPFPAAVAGLLCEDLSALIANGHLVEHPMDGDPRPIEAGRLPVRDGGLWLSFADAGTRALARAAQEYPSALHRVAAHAWEAMPPTEEQVMRVAWHELRAGEPSADALRRAVLLAIDRGEPGEVERWLRLKDLWARTWNASSDRWTDDYADDFRLAHARLRAALALRPATVARQAVVALAGLASTPEQRAGAQALLVVYDLHAAERRPAIERAAEIAFASAAAFPGIAAEILRESALARLALDDVEAALSDCNRAHALAREARLRAESDAPTDPAGHVEPDPRPTRAEIEVATTLSAALIYGGRTALAVQLCEEMAVRCALAGAVRGQAAFLVNLAAGHLHLGRRHEAGLALAAARPLQSRHRDPSLAAWCALLGARLAVERADLHSGRVLLDEAMTWGQALGAGRLLAEAWTLALDLALHTDDPAEASRVFGAYADQATPSPQDLWPAALARWRWRSGDLDGALATAVEPRAGHAGAMVEAERCRLLLVAGRAADARAAAESLATRAQSHEFVEVVLFARLVAGAASGASDAAYLPLVTDTRESRWCHLYLGALHLDALRRQLRGENVSGVLRQLRARARAVGHSHYLALAREEAW